MLLWFLIKDTIMEQPFKSWVKWWDLQNIILYLTQKNKIKTIKLILGIKISWSSLGKIIVGNRRMSYSILDQWWYHQKILKQITWKSLGVLIDKRTKAVEEILALGKLALSRKISFLKRKNYTIIANKSQLNKLTRETSRQRRAIVKFKISIAKFNIIQQLIALTILSTLLAPAQCNNLTIWIKIEKMQVCNNKFIKNLDQSKEFHHRTTYEVIRELNFG